MEIRGPFTVKDVKEYKEYLEDELLDDYNNWKEGDEIDGFRDIDFENEDFYDEFEIQIGEYEEVKSFCEEVENYRGETIIHEGDFEDYCRDFVEECYDLSGVPDFVKDNIDWDGVAEDIKSDYSAVEYDGETFYVR